MRLAFFCVVWMMLIGCTSHDEAYYRAHPKMLAEALKRCPQDAPEAVSCDQLQKLTQTFRTLMTQIQQSPQSFGQSILSLQENCSRLPTTLKRQSTCAEELTMRLAIVRWLESPES